MAQNIYSADQSQALQSTLAKLGATQDIDVLIEIQEDQIELILKTEITTEPGKTEKRNVWIKYIKTDDGCLVVSPKNEELLSQLEFFQVSNWHLDHAIGTLDVLKRFCVSVSIHDHLHVKKPSANTLLTHELFLESLNTMLATRQKPLNAFTFEIKLWQEPFTKHAAKIISHLNVQFLKSILLRTPQPVVYLNLKSIATLEQWQSAEEVKMDKFSTDLKIDAFIHFRRAEIGLYPRTFNELLLLKDHFLNHETAECFTLVYTKQIYNKYIVNASELFGKSEHVKHMPGGALYNKKWYFPVGDDAKFDILVKYYPRWEDVGPKFVFQRVEATFKFKGFVSFGREYLQNVPPTDSIITQSENILLSIKREIENAEDHSFALWIYESQVIIDIILGAVPNKFGRTKPDAINKTTKISIFYKPRGDFCLIESDKKQNVIQSSVSKVSVLHLEYLLSYVSLVKSFDVLCPPTDLVVNSFNENTIQMQESILKCFEAMLKGRNSQLRVQDLYFSSCEKPANMYLPGILACLDPVTLRFIELYGDGGEIQCDGLMKLKQWNEKDLLCIENFYIKSEISKFLHSNNVMLTFAKVTHDDLILLKEHFLVETTPEHFLFNFHRYTKASELSNNANNIEPDDVFGETDHFEYDDKHESYKKIWLFPHKVYNNINVRIDYCATRECVFYFGYAYKEVKQEEEVDTNFDLLSLIPTNYQVMKSIIEKCSIFTIQSIRKVCKTLRSFVDTTHFDFPDRRFWLTFDGDNCRLELFNAEEGIVLAYDKEMDGCTFWAEPPIAYGSGFINSRMIVDETPLDVCIRDLQCIMKPQKTIFREFALTLRSMDEEYIFRLRQALKSQKPKLKAETVHLLGVDLQMMARILSYFDENKLKSISLKYDLYKKVEEKDLESGEIVSLRQWDKAEKLIVHGCAVLFPIESIGHFLEVEVCFRKLSIDDLLYLKEVFIHSTVNRKFELKCRLFNAENLYETLGVPILETIDKLDYKRWFFRMQSNRQKAVCIDYLEHVAGFREITFFKFSHVELSKIPTDVVLCWKLE